MIKLIKPFFKGIKDSIKSRSLNPFYFNISDSQKESSYSDFYLICKIKHEAHLLDKATKNPYVEGRGALRKAKIERLLSELSNRDVSYKEVSNWAYSILEKYDSWGKYKASQHCEGSINFSIFPVLSVPSVRFWALSIPDKESILKCVAAAQMAPASCNRQAFLVKIAVNTTQNFKDVGASNASMFSAAPYRVFIFINMRCYSEKYSSFIDLGMFAQNFVLHAKELGLGCCCCYASEHLEKGQSYWRNEFDLGDEYYCGLSILVGYPFELVEKPPRLPPEKITNFKRVD